MLKVISFCLWGVNLDYNIGAIKNVQIAKDLYPGWEVWIYHDISTPTEILNKLTSLGTNLIKNEENYTGIEGMFKRMDPCFTDGVDYTLVRDADSRLNTKEVAAVNHWLSVDCSLHIMRDHKAHVWPIMGGMFGCKSLSSPVKLSFPKLTQYADDQRFLAEHIYTKYINDQIAHDSHNRVRYFSSIPFPKADINIGSFVGQRITWEDKIGKE